MKPEFDLHFCLPWAKSLMFASKECFWLMLGSVLALAWLPQMGIAQEEFQMEISQQSQQQLD